MPKYRAYKVGVDGRYSGAVELICADDAEGMEQAKKLIDGQDIDL
jgi:hypothetical protein